MLNLEGKSSLLSAESCIFFMGFVHDRLLSTAPPTFEFVLGSIWKLFHTHLIFDNLLWRAHLLRAVDLFRRRRKLVLNCLGLWIDRGKGRSIGGWADGLMGFVVWAIDGSFAANKWYGWLCDWEGGLWSRHVFKTNLVRHIFFIHLKSKINIELPQQKI